MPEKDYYSVLGVGGAATEGEIRKAFRNLAKRWHPDANRGDKDAERRFKEINEAYEVLSDGEKRAQYDQLRKAREAGYGAGGFDFSRFRQGAGPSGGAFTFDDLGGFGDLFSNIFGREARFSRTAERAYRPQKGEDTVFSFEVSFDDAIRGGKRSISVPRTEACARCNGTGGEPGSTPTACPSCGGRGAVSSFQGAFGISRPCPQCLGRGTINANPCRVCLGRGVVDQTRTITVSIPKGMRDGAKIRLSGQGEPGIADGPPGDMYLLVRTAPHPEFERRDNDIYSKVTVDMVQAALGAKVPVRTLDGEVTLTIAPGTQPGTRLRLRGRGVKSAEGAQGDHYVTVGVRVPTDLSPEQRRVLEEFARSG